MTLYDEVIQLLSILQKVYVKIDGKDIIVYNYITIQPAMYNNMDAIYITYGKSRYGHSIFLKPYEKEIRDMCISLFSNVRFQIDEITLFAGCESLWSIPTLRVILCTTDTYQLETAQSRWKVFSGELDSFCKDISGSCFYSRDSVSNTYIKIGDAKVVYTLPRNGSCFIEYIVEKRIYIRDDMVYVVKDDKKTLGYKNIGNSVPTEKSIDYIHTEFYRGDNERRIQIESSKFDQIDILVIASLNTINTLV